MEGNEMEGYRTGTFSATHLTVTLPAELATEVRRDAAIRGLSVSSYIRMRLVELREGKEEGR